MLPEETDHCARGSSSADFAGPSSLRPTRANIRRQAGTAKLVLSAPRLSHGMSSLSTPSAAE
jgi:hypothetical protein